MPENSEQDHWLLLGLVKTVEKIEKSVDALKDERIRQMETQQAVQGEKVARLEKLIYGIGTIAAAELVALIVQWLTRGT